MRISVPTSKIAAMTDYKLTIEESPSPEEVARVNLGLDEYNISQVGDANYRLLRIFMRDESGTVVGGLLGATFWDWLYVETLWVTESLRRSGCGIKLLAAAEAEAIKRGCRRAYLDTFSFQARPFYERLGYEAFGVLKNFPVGHDRIFLQKELSS